MIIQFARRPDITKMAPHNIKSLTQLINACRPSQVHGGLVIDYDAACEAVHDHEAPESTNPSPQTFIKYILKLGWFREVNDESESLRPGALRQLPKKL